VPYVGQVGTSVKIDHVVTRKYTTLYKNQSQLRLALYVSPLNTPIYIADEPLHNIATIDMDLSKASDPNIAVSVYFGLTEIKVKACEEGTDKQYESTIKFNNGAHESEIQQVKKRDL